MVNRELYLSQWHGELSPEVCMAPSHYLECLAQFEAQPACPGSIILLGDSLTEFADWDCLLQDNACTCKSAWQNKLIENPNGSLRPTELKPTILNRGIAGDMIEGMTLRLDEMKRHKPSVMFLMAGCNNFVKYPSVMVEQVWEAYKRLIFLINGAFPYTSLFVASTLPLNPMSGDHYHGINRKISQLNKLLQLNSLDSIYALKVTANASVRTNNKLRYTYYDIVPELSDSNGYLRFDLTVDGCHLNAAGYRIWAARIAQMVRKNCVPAIS